jgi:hypothetical protein
MHLNRLWIIRVLIFILGQLGFYLNWEWPARDIQPFRPNKVSLWKMERILDRNAYAYSQVIEDLRALGGRKNPLMGVS